MLCYVSPLSQDTHKKEVAKIKIKSRGYKKEVANKIEVADGKKKSMSLMSLPGHSSYQYSVSVSFGGKHRRTNLEDQGSSTLNIFSFWRDVPFMVLELTFVEYVKTSVYHYCLSIFKNWTSL